MNTVQHVGFGEELIRWVCKFELMRYNSFNVASVLCGFPMPEVKSFSVDYYGSEYQGRIDNIADWLVYFFGHSDASKLSFARAIVMFLKYNTTKPFNIYDVGAGRGAFSLALADSADHVVAFEQSMSRYSHLQKNVAARGNDKIVTFPIKLSDASDRSYLPVDGFRGTAKDRTKASRTECRAAIKRGDNVVDACNLPSPDLIRINAGSDARQVLHGFESTLDKSQPIVVIEQPMSRRERFADETSLRSVLYKDVRLYSLYGSTYRQEYRLDNFDPQASRIICYPEAITRMISYQTYKLAGLKVPSYLMRC